MGRSGTTSNILTDGRFVKFQVAVLEQLPRDIGQDELLYWINHQKELKRFLDKLREGSTEIEVWKTIRLDPQFTKEEALKDPASAFAQALEQAHKVSDWAKILMGRPAFKQALVEADLNKEYELVIRTTAQLTGKTNETSTTAEVFAGAEASGFGKCPLWLGPMLRLKYPDQPTGEWLRMYMEPIVDSVGFRSLFVVSHVGSVRWLHDFYADPVNHWDPAYQWVLLRRN